MRGTQIVLDQSLNAARLACLAKAGESRLHGGDECFADQRFLRGEMAVEAAVSKTGVGHETGHAHRFETLFPKAFGGGFDDAAMGGFLVVGRVAHGKSERK